MDDISRLRRLIDGEEDNEDDPPEAVDPIAA